MSDEPRPIGEGLDRVIRSLRQTTASGQVGVVARWREAVGDVVADHARPVSLEAGRLLVEVDDPGWATQLRYLESTLVAQLAAVLGTGVVTRVNVRVRR